MAVECTKLPDVCTVIVTADVGATKVVLMYVHELKRELCCQISTLFM
jgi:hypothetical protein